MHIPNMAIGTLAVLAAQELSPAASVSPTAPALDPLIHSDTSLRDTLRERLATATLLEDTPSVASGDRAIALESNPNSPWQSVSADGRTNIDPDRPTGVEVPASLPRSPRRRTTPSPATLQFSDIQGHWAQNFIEPLARKGAIRGFPDGTFKPDAPMTRAQFAAMLEQVSRSYDLELARAGNGRVQPPAAFADVPVNYWASHAIQTAWSAGFLGGYPDGAFKPDRAISRVQVMVALVKGFELGGNGSDPLDLDAYFRDASQIPDYAKPSIRIAIATGLIDLDRQGRWFRPNQVATRADVAAMLHRAIEQPDIRSIPMEVREAGSAAADAIDRQVRDSLDETNDSDPIATNRFERPEPSIETAVVPELGRSQLTEDPETLAYIRPSQVKPQTSNPEPSEPEPAIAPFEDNLRTSVARLRTLQRHQQSIPPLAAAPTYLPTPTQMQRGFIWPAQGTLTSGYGMRWGRLHKGIDIASAIGTPILAAASGVVTYAGWNRGGYGNLVEIEHPDGSLTRYAHNQRILVRTGQQVKQGQQIAYMGNTGYSTGPHLHFEIHPPNRGAVDPMAYLSRDRLHADRVVAPVGQGGE